MPSSVWQMGSLRVDLHGCELKKESIQLGNTTRTQKLTALKFRNIVLAGSITVCCLDGESVTYRLLEENIGQTLMEQHIYQEYLLLHL